MNFFEAVSSVIRNYVGFSGRASRSEYWYWVLFAVIVAIALRILDTGLFPDSEVPVLGGVFSIITLLPSLAVAVRRLHDVDRTGWWLLIMFTVIGLIFPLLIWSCPKGTAGPNRFGPDPLAVKT